MTKFIATIQHHSISRARRIEVNGTLKQAKIAASREFGQEQRDYDIAIFEDGEYGPLPASTRRVGERKWHDWEGK